MTWYFIRIRVPSYLGYRRANDAMSGGEPSLTPSRTAAGGEEELFHPRHKAG